MDQVYFVLLNLFAVNEDNNSLDISEIAITTRNERNVSVLHKFSTQYAHKNTEFTNVYPISMMEWLQLVKRKHLYCTHKVLYYIDIIIVIINIIGFCVFKLFANELRDRSSNEKLKIEVNLFESYTQKKQNLKKSKIDEE